MSARPGSRPHWRPAVIAAGIATAVFLLGGCVYLRLLALKHQLGDFDRNFTLETADGLRLRCRKPVLLTGDLRWLGVMPGSIRRLGSSERWLVHWVKKVPLTAGEREPEAHNIELELNFTDNKLTGFLIAERYFAFFPKPFFVGLLRGLGGASVDRAQRSVSAHIPLSSADLTSGRPTLASLAALLGRPTEQHTEGSLALLRYRYLPTSPDSNGGDFDLLFTFDPATGDMLQMEGRSPVGKMLLNFAPAVAATAPAPSPLPAPASP